MKTMIAAFALVAFGTGCAGPETGFDYRTHTWTSAQSTQAMDHVSGKLVAVDSAVKRSYLGETYYFQNEADARTFDSNPYAYLYNDYWTNKPDRFDQN